MSFSYYVYAIYSPRRNYIYVGFTNNVERRIEEHQRGYNKTTRPYRPFILIPVEKHVSRGEARKREKYLKGGSGKKYLRALISPK